MSQSTHARVWLRSTAAAIAAGVLVASVMSYRDWRLNPGDVFRGPDGTDWGVVWDTFASWMWPVALAVGVATVTVLYVVALLKRT